MDEVSNHMPSGKPQGMIRNAIGVPLAFSFLITVNRGLLYQVF